MLRAVLVPWYWKFAFESIDCPADDFIEIDTSTVSSGAGGTACFE